MVHGEAACVKRPATRGTRASASGMTFTPESPKPGAPANVVLSVDGKQVAKGRIDEQVPQRCGTETMDVGMDCVSPVCHDYEAKGPFPFTGRIESVTFKFGAHKPPTGMERLKLSARMD
jgi:arylsulfatase